MLVKRAFQPEATRAIALTAAGALLVASTYGMARFGVGLLHPAMAAERPGVAGALPSAGTAQFASYCVAAGLAGLLVPRRSRAVAAAAGVAAGLGCLGLALSTSAGWFVASAYVSGAGAGFASPALVGLLDAVVPERMAGAAQAVVNSGTSVGVVMTGLLATAVTAPGPAWLLMAVACLAAGGAVVVLSSGATVDGAATGPVPSSRRSPGRTASWALPLALAVGAGVTSAAVWTFGPTVVVGRGALQPDQVGLLWTALGVGGLAGAFVARPVARHGPTKAFVLCTAALLVGSVAVLAPSGDEGTWPLVGAACFGAGYMSMSGVLILWGRLLDPRGGAAATAWLFIALAVGQAVGSHLLGAVFA